MTIKPFISLLAAATSLAASALAPLPVDPAVTIDTLENGLTVYLRHNAEPKGQADFFLAQRVGSVNEEESQRGLAHFLEHMCFNGTKHFPGNSLIDYLESIGVKFGANLNAYTSTDETVYNICAVPTARATALDSCLLILRDWSHDLLLDDKDINEERGVIEGEWRQRQGSANMRLMEKALPHMYPGSLYGQRMPIGLMSVVRNFSPDVLRDYYHKWYNPVNQCVIVVGDIDVEAMRSRIRQLWSDIPASGALRSPRLEVADNEHVIATVQSDPEQQTSSVMVYLKHDDLPEAQRNTILQLRHELASDLVISMLAERFDEIEERPDAPFTNMGLRDRNFFMSRTRPALMIRATAKPGCEQKTVSLIATELQRAARHGFTPGELQRAKLDARAAMDNAYARREKTANTTYARRYVRHALDGGPLPSDEARYKMMRGVYATVNLDSVNAYIRRIVAPDGRNVVLASYVSPERAESFGDAQLADAWTSVDTAAIEPYVDSFASRPLLAAEPEPGTIVSETPGAFGSTVWTLGNGVRVHVLKTDHTPDQVLIQAVTPGGLSAGFDPKYIAEYHLINDAIAVSGAGEHSAADIRRILAGRKIRSEVKIENMEEQMAASTTRADLRTALQLLHLKATALRPDSTAYATLIEREKITLDSHRGNPTYIMGDSIHYHVYNRHPLGSKLTDADLDNASYRRIIDIYRDRFSDFSDFDFFIVGDFDTDTLRSYVREYIASLPSGGRIEQRADIGYRYTPGDVEHHWTCPMQVPQTIVYALYNTAIDFNLDNLLNARALSSVIANSLRRDLREKRGWTYGVKSHIGLHGHMNGDDPDQFIMPVYIRVAPENANSTFRIVHETIMAMTDPANIPAAEIEAFRQQLIKDHAESLDSNSYKLSLLKLHNEFGLDMETGFDAIVASITPETVAAFARATLPHANRMRLSLAPAP